MTYKCSKRVRCLKFGCFECNGEVATSEDDAGNRGIIKYYVERGMTPGQTIKGVKSSHTRQNASRVLISK